MIAAFKDALGFSPKPEHSPQEYLNLLSSGEQRQVHQLWDFLVAHWAELEGVDFSLALVGGFARAFEPKGARRMATLKDVDICIATSVRPYSQQEARVVNAADQLLRQYLTEQGILDEQLAGPDWQIGYRNNYTSVREKLLKGRYSSRDLRFITKADDTQGIRPFDIQFAGIGEPNMFKQPQLSIRATKKYAPLFSTLA